MKKRKKILPFCFVSEKNAFSRKKKTKKSAKKFMIWVCYLFQTQVIQQIVHAILHVTPFFELKIFPPQKTWVLCTLNFKYFIWLKFHFFVFFWQTKLLVGWAHSMWGFVFQKKSFGWLAVHSVGGPKKIRCLTGTFSNGEMFSL